MKHTFRKITAAIMAVAIIGTGSAMPTNTSAVQVGERIYTEEGIFVKGYGCYTLYEYKYLYDYHKTPVTNAVYMIGSQGEEVKWIQCAMNWIFRRNNQPLKIDGIYGTQTAYWVQAYQKAVGITVDGKFGPQTRSKVMDYLNRNVYRGKYYENLP